MKNIKLFFIFLSIFSMSILIHATETKSLTNFIDFQVTDLNYNSTNGNLNFTIKNIGDKDAIGFSIRIFNEHLKEEKTLLVNYLKSNESKNINLDVKKNQSRIYLYLDFYKQINESDEENNIVKWPFKAEVCNDNIDNDGDGYVDESCTELCPEMSYANRDYWARVWCDVNLNSSLEIYDNLTNINFALDWNKGIINNISADNLSFRMGRTINVIHNNSVISLKSNDGAKIWIDEVQILKDNVSSWFNNYKIHNLTSGLHKIKIEYFDKKGNANIEFSMYNKSYGKEVIKPMKSKNKK